MEVVGNDNGSDEYNAAIELQRVFKDSIPSGVSGEIYICPNVTFFGQTVKDVDIIVVAQLQNCQICAFVNDGDKRIRKNVEIDSFCTTIEVKSHGVEGVQRIGTDWYVKYNDGWHDVTEQSNKQKISAMNYFTNQFFASPFVTNIIWFTEIDKTDYKSLATEGRTSIITNVLCNKFSFSDFIQLIINQKTPYYNGGDFILDCGVNDQRMVSIKNVMKFFSSTNIEVGNITRAKMELITQKKLDKVNPIEEKVGVKVLRGRAGTGKTIELIRSGLKIVDEIGKRVLILTYNRALVSDLKRLFSLTELPDMFDEACLSVMTMHSYFYNLINTVLYEGKLKSSVFLERYDYYLNEMKELLQIDGNAKNDVWNACKRDDGLNWDYLLVDEAQDWTELEKEIVLLMFDASNIIVADGGTQFVRRIAPCNWMTAENAKSIRLKYCLRQKNNIIKFINAYISMLEKPTKKVIGSDELIGGKVIICTDHNRFFEMLKNEKKKLLECGNIGYDLLFLTPSDYVRKEYYKREFMYINEFKDNGFDLWDGTNDKNRLEYPINPDESRVIQYESARGLEGWTVCCLGFDKWIDEKIRQFVYESNNTLFLQSRDDYYKEYLLNWILLPFSRAIDTLILCLDDTDEKTSKQLLQIAQEHSDYVEVI